MIKTGMTLAACSMEQIDAALASHVQALILMNSSILDLMQPALQKKRSKPVFLHIDLIRGLASDVDAIRFLSRHVPAVQGIVSTRSNVIRAANKEGLFSIQRVFLIDGRSFQASVDSIRDNRPKAIELMPALGAPIIERFRKTVKVPIIAGGLVQTVEQIRMAFFCGADAVSYSSPDLWDYRTD